MSKLKLKEVSPAEAALTGEFPEVKQPPILKEADAIDAEMAAEKRLLRFRVQLQDNPPFEVKAFDRMEAVEVYKRRCGIIATPHKFEVQELE